ncbi:enterochelin esterase [Pantoea sp. EA-12]|uniref:enterochelin esterase n=1 Tax=Pantoea sp. EA-12 TaxID=3043303 RepID=UPI0024B551B1|nr:enterochelin esterase [Pantoea sp. EA-12]MDI9219740.1 enterochelin esterase [Pantoea sp. EA-12]
MFRSDAELRAEKWFPTGTVATWLEQPHLGHESWWDRVRTAGTPVIERDGTGTTTMHFFWRDPQGHSALSSTRRVYIDINGVTDHHSQMPESLARIGDSNVWHWSTAIESDWRGSYSLIPAGDGHLPPLFCGDDETCRVLQRKWWISLMPLAIPDILNASPPFLSSRRFALSNAQMPDAPDQSAWQLLDAGLADTWPDSLQTLQWHSALLNVTRNVWLYTTGHTDEAEQRPLVILLDGQNWVYGQPIFSALDQVTAAGELPPACWLFIDVIDSQHREVELPCNETFWQAMQQELLPLARQHATFSNEGNRTVVAGQSYGGLAALYAGLHWPQRFGRVLTQSGSFWWPHLQYIRDYANREQHAPGLLLQRLQNNQLPGGKLTIFQEVGDREADMLYVNQQIRPALEAAGHTLSFRRYAGGHDALCWRGGLIDGCRWLLADFLSSDATSEGEHHV